MPINVPPFTVLINPATTQHIIVGEHVDFTVSADAGTPPYTYRWYVNNVFVNDTTTAFTFTPETTGNFQVQARVVDDEDDMVFSDAILVVVSVLPQTGYCSNAQIKERLLITPEDDTYDDALTSAGVEASRYIDNALKPFDTVPLTVVTDQITYIAADIGAGIMIRRMKPENMDTGWWAQGIKKLADYIWATYLMADQAFTWNTNDPAQVLAALDKKAISLSEARTLLKAMTYDPTTKTEAEIDLIEAQIALIEAQIAKLEAETAQVLEETEQMPKRGTTFEYVDDMDEYGTP